MYVNSKQTQAGFSLIELMVVVAIIGLLAAIAVPQFSKFQNRAKTSEAQTHMSGIYTGEQAYIAQWGSYYGALESIGYAVAAQYTRYNCGFTAVGTLPTNATPGTAKDFITAGTGAYTGACSGGTATCTPPSDAAALAAVVGSVTPTTTAFTAACIAKFQTAAQNDEWTITQAQKIQNILVGI